MKTNYIENFENLGFGMFVHFGLYSIVGKGEWYLECHPNANKDDYEKLPQKFNPKKNWARELVRTAKSAGCKYITLTTRHHDGFSLYDTRGLNEYDAPHAKAGRDLVAEFADACQEGGVVPFFYHTLLDWHHPDYNTNFPRYIDYLCESVEILCTRYGEIGGLWFDGMWNKPSENWQEDRLYGLIRKYQPNAMIINNTGLSARGKVGHPEIDGVTFERGTPHRTESTGEKHIAGEMCQVLNDHWGYAQNDCNYKSTRELIENLVDCRHSNCNFLLNLGPRADGSVRPIDKAFFSEIGKWVKANKGFIYKARYSDIRAENALMLTDGNYTYAVIKNVEMSSDPNVAFNDPSAHIKIDAKIKKAVWLDNLKPIAHDGTSFSVEPFPYGSAYAVRVARLTLED